MLLMRSIFGTIGILCNFYAVDHLLVSDASMLNKLSPFFVIIFSALFLKEKANTVQKISVVIAFIGALFVIKPSFNMACVPAVIGLISGMGAGLVSALNYCRQITDSPTEIITNRVVNVSKIEMTENAARGQVNVFNKNFLSTNHLLLFVLTPLAVFISYFAADVVALFFKRGQFGLLAAAQTTAFLRPMIFMLVLLVPAYLQNNAIAAWCKIKENFPYALVSALAFTAGAAWVLPRHGAHAYPYLLLGGLVLGFAVNAVFFRKYFPFVNYFRSFWELLRLLAINVIALVPAAAVRVFLGENDPFLNLLFSGSVFVTALLACAMRAGLFLVQKPRRGLAHQTDICKIKLRAVSAPQLHQPYAGVFRFELLRQRTPFFYGPTFKRPAAV